MSVQVRVLLVAVLTCASCGETDGPTTNSLTSAPTAPAVTTQFAQGSLRLVPVGSASCETGPAFVAGFAVVVVPVQPVTLDRVMVRLLDGTTLGGSAVGGPPFLFSNADLSRQFGSTVIVGARTFPLEAPFGCLEFQPRALAADLVFFDDAGVERFTTISAPLPPLVPLRP